MFLVYLFLLILPVPQLKKQAEMMFEDGNTVGLETVAIHINKMPNQKFIFQYSICQALSVVTSTLNHDSFPIERQMLP